MRGEIHASFPFPTRTHICRGDSGCAQETKTASAASPASREARGRQERERLALIIGPEATEQTNKPCRRFADKELRQDSKTKCGSPWLATRRFGGFLVVARVIRCGASYTPAQQASLPPDARCQMQKGPKETRQLVAGAGAAAERQQSGSRAAAEQQQERELLSLQAVRERSCCPEASSGRSEAPGLKSIIIRQQCGPGPEVRFGQRVALGPCPAYGFTTVAGSLLAPLPTDKRHSSEPEPSPSASASFLPPFSSLL